MKGNPAIHITRIYAGQNVKTGKWSRPYLCRADRLVLDGLCDFYGFITDETDTDWGNYADCVIYCIAEMTPSGLGDCHHKVCTAQDLLKHAKKLERERFLSAETNEELL